MKGHSGLIGWFLVMLFVFLNMSYTLGQSFGLGNSYESYFRDYCRITWLVMRDSGFGQNTTCLWENPIESQKKRNYSSRVFYISQPQDIYYLGKFHIKTLQNLFSWEWKYLEEPEIYYNDKLPIQISKSDLKTRFPALYEQWKSKSPEDYQEKVFNDDTLILQSNFGGGDYYSFYNFGFQKKYKRYWDSFDNIMTVYFTYVFRGNWQPNIWQRREFSLSKLQELEVWAQVQSYTMYIMEYEGDKIMNELLDEKYQNLRDDYIMFDYIWIKNPRKDFDFTIQYVYLYEDGKETEQYISGTNKTLTLYGVKPIILILDVKVDQYYVK